jgi:hypothetical protein
MRYSNWCSFLFGFFHAIVYCPLTVFGMDMIGPESGFLYPLPNRITKQFLGMPAYIRKAKSFRIRFPYNAVYRIYQ